MRNSQIALFALAAGAALSVAGSLPAAAADSSRVCIYNSDVRMSRIVDNQTIQFEMRNGKIWENKLEGSCPGLKLDNGFTMDVSPRGEICENLQTIYTVRRRQACLLGKFTQLDAPHS